MAAARVFHFLLLALVLGAGACAATPTTRRPRLPPARAPMCWTGAPTTGIATAVRNPAYHVLDATGDHAAEMLTITCVGTVAANAAPEQFSLSFIKLATEDDAAFRMLPSPGIDVLRYNPANGSDYTNYVLGANMTVRKTSAGGFSGTFSGAYAATATAGQSTFKSGVFTDVHP